MKASGRIQIPIFARLSKRVRASQEDLIIDAVKIFVKTAASRVPVDTGTARATWLELANAVGVHIPIDPKTTRKGYGIDVGISKSSYELETSGNKSYFSWESDVRHYELNEQYPTVKSAPWQSLAEGQAKMKAFILDTYGRVMATALRNSIEIKERVY